jgi:hypothetical protein
MKVSKYFELNCFVPVVVVFLTLTNLIAVVPGSSAQITTGTLIKEMADLKRLAEYPSPFYNTVQYSSYDRRSTFPDAPDWFANADGFGGEPVPGFEKVLKEPDSEGIGEYLICDVEGPGAIVRLWTAAINGTIRLYLDGEKEPAYDGSAFDFFTNTYHALFEENEANQKGTFTQNMAGYYPVPFSKRCKIIWRGNIKDLHFYHVNMRLYEKGTSVKTFSTEDIRKFSEEIENAGQVLKNTDLNYNTGKGDSVRFASRLEAGEEKEILHINGSKGITCFEMQVIDNDLEEALRQTVLRISFDGASDPQVQSPVGDFFGTAPGINPYQSLPFTVTKEGRMICRYFMPFSDSVSIKIENLRDKAITVAGKVVTEEYDWDKNRSMYFRAKWRVSHDMKASYLQPSDIPYLQASGKGVFVGAAAHLMNPSDVPSTYGNWWGEGDEKIFVDGNPSPVFFGTGSEDYFNYAWSSPDIFYHAYCGQPRNDGPGTRGFVTNYRWHVIDEIPFKEQFAFYMELLSHEPVPGFSYARIAYHYGFRGMHDDNVRISKGDVRRPELPDKWYPRAVKGSANSLFYQAEELLSAGNKNTGMVSGTLWAGGELLEWQPNKKGEKLVLNFPVLEDGKYVIHITARLTGDSGQIRAKINGVAFNSDQGIINLATGDGTLSRTHQSAPVILKKGASVLTLESLEAKPVAVDFIWVQKSYY